MRADIRTAGLLKSLDDEDYANKNSTDNETVLTTEMAEDIRSKLDKTLLTSNTSASECINNFLQYTKLLDDLGEAYTSSKNISIFLNQIKDPGYSATKESCIEDKLNLDQCIERIWSKERRLGKSKADNRRGINIRRDQLESYGSRVINKTRDLPIKEYKNEKGFYSIPREIWKKLPQDE